MTMETSPQDTPNDQNKITAINRKCSFFVVVQIIYANNYRVILVALFTQNF